MPTTPGLNIPNQTTWDRVFAAFHGSQAEYLAWLTTALREEVTQRELAAVDVQANATKATKVNELRNALEPMVAPPAPPAP